MDCRAARLLLDFTRPFSTELEASEAEALKSHLAGCSDCDTLARSEHQVDERLGAAMRAVPVPDGLRTKLLTRLQTERRDWYLRRLRWGLAIAAAAAVVLLVVWLNWGVPTLLEPNLEALRQEVISQNTASPDKVEDWFKERYNVTTAAPIDFNYALLTYYDLAYCQDKPALVPNKQVPVRVPMLLFTRVDRIEEEKRYRVASARVYILSDKEFNLKALPEEPSDSGGYTVEVRRPQDKPHLAYVIVYRGARLSDFLTEPPPRPPL